MRTFPRAPRRRVAALSAVAAVVLATLAYPTAQAIDPDKLEDRKQKVEKRIDDAHHDLERSSEALERARATLVRSRSRLSVARGALAGAEAKLSAAEARDAAMQARLDAAVARLETARLELKAGRQDVRVQRVEVSNTVVDFYEEGDPQLLGLVGVLDAQDPGDITRRLSFMDSVVDEQDATYDRLRAAEVLLTVREQQVEQARDEVAVQRREAAAHLVEMKELRADAAAKAAVVRDAVTANRAAQSEAKRLKRRDLAELRELRAQERRIKERLLAAARRAAARGRSYQGDTSGIFDQPVNGYVTSPYGYRVHPIYGYYSLHNGIDFGAGCGQSLYAVGSGTVIETYYSSVYGYRLYLSLGTYNGRNVTAVYNHLSGYAAREGERVSRGERVGYVGSTGWSTGCHLHFMILVNGSPVDPTSWI